MKKSFKIVYWVSTSFVSLLMLFSGVMPLIQQNEQQLSSLTKLGYPTYFLLIIGVWKILGGIVLFIPKTPLLKEWAYAGFFFLMSGAAFSHIASGDSFGNTFPSLLTLILIILSWYFRPLDRKISKY